MSSPAGLCGGILLTNQRSPTTCRRVLRLRHTFPYSVGRFLNTRYARSYLPPAAVNVYSPLATFHCRFARCITRATARCADQRDRCKILPIKHVSRSLSGVSHALLRAQISQRGAARPVIECSVVPMNTLLFELWFSCVCVTLLDCDITLLGNGQNGCCVLCYTRKRIPLLIECAQPECTICRVNRALLTRIMLLTGCIKLCHL